MVPLPGLGVLRKLRTLHISIIHIAQSGPQGHFSPPPPPLERSIISITVKADIEDLHKT